MVIKILGTGCSKCKALYENVKKAVEETGINATIIKEEDIVKIMTYNVMQLPALVIDEKVVAKGMISFSEVKSVLNQFKNC